jgi:hypothetical protein
MGRPGGKVSPRVAELTVNQQRALDLRREHKTIQDIATELGVPRSTAYDWLCGALERSDEAMAAKAGAHRELEAQRIDALMRSLWPEALAPGKDRLAVVDRVVKLMDQRAKLLGLNLPPQPDAEADALKRERLEAEIRLLRARAAQVNAGAGESDALKGATTAELEALLAAYRASQPTP